MAFAMGHKAQLSVTSLLVNAILMCCIHSLTKELLYNYKER